MSGIIGVISVSPAVPGASAVQGIAKVTVSDSSSRVTLFTPASGKKVRIVAWTIHSSNTTGADCILYFGTGASLSSDFTKFICSARVEGDVSPFAGGGFPDGGGPVGAVDEVVSMVTGNNISGDALFGIVFREE